MPFDFVVNCMEMRRLRGGKVGYGMPATVGREPMEPFGAAGGVVLLRFSAWAERFPWLSAGVSTRIGGVSLPPWNSLNCGLHVGDRAEDVTENRRRVAEAAGLSFRMWTCAEQVHGKEVFVATADAAGAGRESTGEAIPGRDALVTNVPQLMLCAFYADCVPILFVDPVRRAVGVAHAGWRGTAAGVAAETVRTMARAFGTVPDDLHAAIGPSIRECCYEVDDNVASRFRDVPESCLTPSSPGRFKLDLAKINRHQLTEAGILPNRIEITNYCTNCRKDLFYSHRGENGRTGRMTAWIALKE